MRTLFLAIAVVFALATAISPAMVAAAASGDAWSAPAPEALCSVAEADAHAPLLKPCGKRTKGALAPSCQHLFAVLPATTGCTFAWARETFPPHAHSVRAQVAESARFRPPRATA